MKPGLTRKVVCWIMGMALLLPSCARAQAFEENVIKAAFVFNFVAFTTWPANPQENGGTIEICINAGSRILPSLGILDGKPLGKATLRLRRLESLAPPPPSCRVVFLDRRDRNEWPLIRKPLEEAGVLTISDDPDIGTGGAVIFMSTHNNRIVFEADLRAASRAGLKLSHRLLRLARKIRQ